MRCHLWKWSMISYLLFTITSKSVFPKCKQFQAIGRVEKPKWGIGTGTRTRTRQMNEWFKLGSMIDINTPPPFFLHASQDGGWYTEPFWKKRYEYKEHSNHSFRLNDVLIIQNIFAFFYRSRNQSCLRGNHNWKCNYMRGNHWWNTFVCGPLNMTETTDAVDASFH